MRPTLSVVIPMYDEQDALPLLVSRLRPVLDKLDASYEVDAECTGSAAPRHHISGVLGYRAFRR